MDAQTERRKHKRFRIQDGVLAVLGPNSNKMGQIVDISQGGLAFYHKDDGKVTNGGSELSILFDGSQSNINYGPLKFKTHIVSNVVVQNQKRQLAGNQRRCSVEFDDLTYYQKSWIIDCIQNFTLPENETAS